MEKFKPTRKKSRKTKIFKNLSRKKIYIKSKNEMVISTKNAKDESKE